MHNNPPTVGTSTGLSAMLRCTGAIAPAASTAAVHVHISAPDARYVQNREMVGRGNVQRLVHGGTPQAGRNPRRRRGTHPGSLSGDFDVGIIEQLAVRSKQRDVVHSCSGYEHLIRRVTVELTWELGRLHNDPWRQLE